MSKLYKSFLTLAVVAALSGASTASATVGNQNGTTITQILAVTGTSAFVAIAFPANIPGDACPAKAVMYIDTSLPKGKAMLSMATAAMLAHLQVDVIGTGTCVVPAGGPFNAETINQLSIHAP